MEVSTDQEIQMAYLRASIRQDHTGSVKYKAAGGHQLTRLEEVYTSDALGVNWNKILEKKCTFKNIT